MLVPLLAGLVSCSDDPVKNGKDSLNDTAVVMNDTSFHGDSVKTDTGSNSTVHYDCSVLRRKVRLNAKSIIQRDMDELSHCGIDSFDFLYVVPNLFPAWASENAVNGNDSATYGDFLKHLNEFRGTDSYYQLHVRVNTLDSLRSVKFNVSKLYAMKPVLGRLGFTEPEWQMFSGFAQSYPVPSKNFTWGQMLDAFEKYSQTAPAN